jgi:hypothetical protein
MIFSTRGTRGTSDIILPRNKARALPTQLFRATFSTDRTIKRSYGCVHFMQDA